MPSIDFDKWRGLDRKTIEWYPAIDEEKCIGCGMCVTGCPRKVYGFDFEKNKATVKNPYNCMVGCSTCQSTCLMDAINFPNRQMIKDIVRKENLIEEAKEKLEEMKESEML